MKFKIFFGTEPKLSILDKDCFNQKGYECRKLFKSKIGQPVVLSQSMNSKTPIWKVEYGFSCMMFPSYEEAMDFCNRKFAAVTEKGV